MLILKMNNNLKLCIICDRPYKEKCICGELIYEDGSSRICPQWNIKLDEIGGITTEEAEQQANFDRICR